MDAYVQEFFKALIAMGLGGLVAWIRSRLKEASEDRIRENNVSRDLNHLKNTQAQHGQTIADLDAKIDRILAIVSKQSTRIAVLEERGKARTSGFIEN
jgi:CRISPR/Cas system CMR-associated protein Cmr5 small subunit